MIPKIIHYCWFGRNPKPELALKCINSWKKYCPDYEIIEWNEDNIDISRMPIFVQQAYEAKAWGFVPDYIRLWIIYNHGGIYLDTDVQMIRNFDSLLGHKCFAGSEDGEHISLGLGFGAEKGNEIIRQNMTVYENMSFINEDGTQNRKAAPYFTTKKMRELGFPDRIDSLVEMEGFVCYPPEYFCPKSFITGITRITKSTYSIHHFDGSWFNEEQKRRTKDRWRKEKRAYLMDYVIHIPNRFLRTLLGEERYEKLKRRIKEG